MVRIYFVNLGMVVYASVFTSRKRSCAPFYISIRQLSKLPLSVIAAISVAINIS